MTLNHKIRQLRLNKNLTQLYVAEELGIDAANYSRLERGETHVTVERIIKIAEIFEVDLSDLLVINKEKTHTKLLEAILIELSLINEKLDQYIIES